MPPDPPTNDLDSVTRAVRALAARWRQPSRLIPWPALQPEVMMLGVGAIALLMAFDEPIARWAMTLPHSIVAVARAVTDFGTSLYMFVVSALIALAAVLARRRVRSRRVAAGFGALAERATYVFATLALAGVSAQIVKHIIGRARPRFIDTLGPYHFEFFAFASNRNSFPSGHSANAFAAALALGIIWPRARPWLLGAATIVALSRIAVRAHYPSDALAGSILGCACAVATGLAFARRGLAVRRTVSGLVPRGARVVRAALRFVADRRPRTVP